MESDDCVITKVIEKAHQYKEFVTLDEVISFYFFTFLLNFSFQIPSRLNFVAIECLWIVSLNPTSR